MTDKVTIARLSLVYSDVATRWFRVAADISKLYNRELRISQGFRSYAEQAALFAQGRTTPGPIVTHAEPGHSWHNFGLAVDSFFHGDDPYLEKDPKGEFLWAEYARLGEAHGFTAGAHFPHPDKPHLEINYDRTLCQIRTIFDQSAMFGVRTFLDRILGVR